MTTQQDVAKKAGVSFITVSRVINGNGYVKEETKEKVLQAIKELNYYPNQIGRALNNKSVNTIGVIAPAPTNHTTEYYNLLMAGIEKSTVAHGFDILLSTYNNDDSEFDYLRLYFQRKVDGLLLITPGLMNPQIEKIKQQNIPCVIIGDQPDDNSLNYIDTDNFGGMYRATEYLINKGHQSIGFLKGDNTSRNARDRFQGYLEAMRKNNLNVNENWIFEGDFTLQSGLDTLKMMLGLEITPTALICANDLMALGVLSEAKNSSINIPADLALIGFDDIPITVYTDPPLSTIKQPLFDMGFTAAEMLFKKMKDPELPPEFKVFPVELIARKST